MDNFDEMEEPVMVSPTGKRKRHQTQNSARSRAKNARYSGEGLDGKLLGGYWWDLYDMPVIFL